MPTSGTGCGRSGFNTDDPAHSGGPGGVTQNRRRICIHDFTFALLVHSSPVPPALSVVDEIMNAEGGYPYTTRMKPQMRQSSKSDG